MNWLIFRIEKLPYHLISEIYITGPQVLCILGAIFSTTIFLYYRKRTYFWCATLFIAVNFFLAILRQHRVDQQEKAIFYAVNQATAVDFIKGDKAVFIGSNGEKGELDYHIRPHRLASGIKDVDFVTLDQEQVKPWFPLSFAGKRYLFIRRPLSHYTSERIHTDYLILCENSVNSLEEVTGLFDFENLIIDGSNSWFTTDQLISEAKQMNFCYHTTKRQGALLIEEN